MVDWRQTFAATEPGKQNQDTLKDDDGRTIVKVDGRTPEEVSKMEEYGYVEVDAFANSPKEKNPSADLIRKAYSHGYFCGDCEYFQHKPNSIEGNPTVADGFCKKLEFRDRAYGCCNVWEHAESE